ncbi:zinc-dependent alcohol dehydrogenase family protein [Sphingobium sp. EM0848]|uniref:zinc-dependent alcohol dehydrogenase family protein n=1 Tax=Sphingobium sp. EM0848 TaxID=2743473 RepID=UPI00159C2566|nr:zinc-dependent alcohol dehydrogenase family protein [Sphingobium sp. EM0848]
MRVKAAVLHELGGPEVLKLATVDVPNPGPGEIRILISAFGLNRSEALFREGRLQLKPVLPSRIGYEAAGIVESVGPGVTEFAVGDSVATLPRMQTNVCGAYGEAMTVPARFAVKSPAGLDRVECAALWSGYMTAYAGLVDLAPVQRGDFVLITAASSSLGPAAIQIVRLLGAHAIAVTRRREKAAAIARSGPADIIVTDEENLGDRVRQITDGRGVSLVFDPVGGPTVSTLAEMTAPYGTIIIYGSLDASPAELPVRALIGRNIAIRGLGLYLEDKPDRLRRGVAFIQEGVANGLLRPLIAERYKLDQIVEAAKSMDAMNHVGKIVVETGVKP